MSLKKGDPEWKVSTYSMGGIPLSAEAAAAIKWGFLRTLREVERGERCCQESAEGPGNHGLGCPRLHEEIVKAMKEEGR